MINELHIWHTHLTHSYLLYGKDQPECAHCKCPLTVKRFQLEWAAFKNIRHNYYTVSTTKDLFKSVDMWHIIDFIVFNLFGFISGA